MAAPRESVVSRSLPMAGVMAVRTDEDGDPMQALNRNSNGPYVGGAVNHGLSSRGKKPLPRVNHALSLSKRNSVFKRI